MRVQDVMTVAPEVCRPEHNLGEAVALVSAGVSFISSRLGTRGAPDGEQMASVITKQQ
jgi:hypothetical protein